MSKLFVVSTPIGNLSDISLRAIETLKIVDCIICEDTRRTGQLLSYYQIKKPLIAYEQYRENKVLPKIINAIKNNTIAALVTDSGTPSVSDPGFKLIRKCIELGISVVSIPGPSALISALVVSGLPTDKFMFIGFLPEKQSHRITFLKTIIKIKDIQKMTYIIYESPYRLVNTLRSILDIFGDEHVVIARELTKIHEEVLRMSLSEMIKYFMSHKPKGEFTIVFNPIASKPF